MKAPDTYFKLKSAADSDLPKRCWQPRRSIKTNKWHWLSRMHQIGGAYSQIVCVHPITNEPITISSINITKLFVTPAEYMLMVLMEEI